MIARATLALMLAGPALAGSLVETAQADRTPRRAVPVAAQTGIASWYGGSQWQGHRMSNGQRYEQDRLTAAHATLPMGTKVLVTLVNSTRSVVVTVTDRPGTRSRVIDLSRGAAAALGIMDRGVAQVRLIPL